MFSVARLRENRKMQPRAARIIFRLSGGGGRVKLWMVRILAKQFRPCFFSENILRKFCAGGFFKMLRDCPLPLPRIRGGIRAGIRAADRGIDFYSSAHFSRPPFARSQRQAAGVAAGRARRIPARPGAPLSAGRRPSPRVNRPPVRFPSPPPFGGGAVGRPATGAMRHSAGCALLRRQRCTCAARGMRDRLRGRAGAVRSPSVIGGGKGRR